MNQDRPSAPFGEEKHSQDEPTATHAEADTSALEVRPDSDKNEVSSHDSSGPHATFDGDASSDDSAVAAEDTQTPATPAISKPKRRRRRQRTDVAEHRLLGRRALCKRVSDIAPEMLKTVKLRILGRYLDSTRGMGDAALTERIVEDASTIVGRDRVLSTVRTIDPDVHRRNLKDIIVNVVLLQEETYSLVEPRLEQKVLEYEQRLVEAAASIDLFDEKKHDPIRAHYCDTYRIVLEAAWRNNDDVSFDEAALLAVLRDRLGVSSEDHRLISSSLNRFPKENCALHTHDEIHDARKELQREGILWSYRDESNHVDVIPFEIADILRGGEVLAMQLQQVNFQRLLEHDGIHVPELRQVLTEHGMDRNGAKAVLIQRIAGSDIQPQEVLDSLDRSQLSDMCRHVGIKSSGVKQELIDRLIGFYDDLTFEERETQDEREEWYNNYELLAARSYSDLRAKKLITKDLDVEHQFERATEFLFEELLRLEIDKTRKVTRADGRIIVNDRQVILWDCKSCESSVNLQDHLDDQFDGYLRREREKGYEPLAMLVIAPSFTPNSMKLAHQYKARTNWDIALVHAGALKHIAEHWSASGTEQPFPVGLFNRTEVIDKERAEFLISLA